MHCKSLWIKASAKCINITWEEMCWVREMDETLYTNQQNLHPALTHQTLTITSALLSHAHNPLGFILFMLMGFTFIEPVSKSIKDDPQTACGHQTDWWTLHLCFVVDVILKYENLSGKTNKLLLERPCQTRLIALAIMYTTFKTDLPWSLRLLNDSTSSSMIST